MAMLQDLRFALRMVRRNPGFSAAAIFIVALGIAATCIVFSFAEAAVFRTLPYRNPSRLVSVTMTDIKAPEEGGWVSAPVLMNWNRNGRKVGGFAVSHWASETMVGAGEPVQLFVDTVSQEAFPILGVSAILGRTFAASDYRSAGLAPVVLSYALWQTRFDGSQDALARSILLDGARYHVVGVMPPGFLMPGSGIPAVCWLPLIFSQKQKADAQDRGWEAWGRLNSNVSIKQAQAALSVLTKQLMNEPAAKPASEWCIEVTPLIHNVVEQWRSALILLLGAVAFLLAIACVNAANLLLVHANSRQKEIAVRVAVGANRKRVIRQLLTESAVLGVFAGGLGVSMAHWGILLEMNLLPPDFRFHTGNFQQMGINSIVLTVTLVTSIVVGIIFGLAPALHASSINLTESLKESGASATSGRGRAKVQSTFVIAEVALSLVLLIGAGLLLRSFLKLQGVYLGFNPNQLLTMQVLLPQYQYPKKRQQVAAYEQLLEKVKSLPGVQSSAFATPLPLNGIHASVELPAQPGIANLSGSEPWGCGTEMVSAQYFETMAIPVLSGRAFTEQDAQGGDPVAIVNEAFAHRYWPGQNPVGKRIFLAYPKPKPVMRIVGLVGNTRDNELWGAPEPMLYYPYKQFMFAAFAGTVIAKTRTPASIAVAMEKLIHSADPQAPISQIETMDQVLSGARAGDRFYLLLVGVFALLALVLAAAGIASTVSYAVSQRRHEIGIRMALGAERSTIIGLVIGEILWLALIGVAVGVAGALALTRFVASQLHGIAATDPLTFVAVSMLLFAVCLLASLVPAIRATSISPAETLRTV
jgi:predicted permease